MLKILKSLKPKSFKKTFQSVKQGNPVSKLGQSINKLFKDHKIDTKTLSANKAYKLAKKAINTERVAKFGKYKIANKMVTKWAATELAKTAAKSKQEQERLNYLRATTEGIKMPEYMKVEKSNTNSDAKNTAKYLDGTVGGTTEKAESAIHLGSGRR